MDEMTQATHDDEINLLDLLKVVLKYKKMVIYIVIICTFGTAIVSLLMTKIYESKAVITPVEAPAAQSNIGNLAAQFGVAMPQSSNVSEIVGLLKSNVLMQMVMEKGKFYDVLFDKDDLKGKTDNEKKWKGIRLLKEELLKIAENKKENTVTISVQYKDPVVAQRIASVTLEELTEHMTTEAKRVADANRAHLDKEIVVASDPLVRQKIYTLIAQQVETAMMSAAKENFAFKVIDPPMVPDKKVKPKRAVMVILAFIISLFAGVLAAFAREHFEKNSSEWQDIRGMIKKPWRRSGGKESIG